LPKLNPETVSELPPLSALFNCKYDSTGASKLYPKSCVPATSPTDTADKSTADTGALDEHANVVADVHAAVSHTASDSAAVAERS
jgi:hypothetical protein